MTLVSVIVPVYNVAPYLERCVRSVLDQTLASLEVILVNDGSTDASGQLCHEFAQSDARVRVLERINGGLADARNAGLAVASGIYVCFLDGDDWTETDMVADMLRAAEEYDADVVVAGCFVDWEDEGGHVIHSAVQVPVSQVVSAGADTLVASPTLLNLLGYAWNKLYRRDLLGVDCRFEAGLSLIEDIVFNADVFERSERMVFVDRCHVHYMHRPRPTLGSTFYADLLDLKLRAVDMTTHILQIMGMPQRELAATRANLQLRALWHAIRKTSEHTAWSLWRQAAHVRGARSEPRARSVQQELLGSGSQLSRSQHVLTLGLYNLPAASLLIAARLRVSLRSIRAARSARQT